MRSVSKVDIVSHLFSSINDRTVVTSSGDGTVSIIALMLAKAPELTRVADIAVVVIAVLKIRLRVLLKVVMMQHRKEA